MAATLVNLNKVVEEYLATTGNFDKKGMMSLKIVAKRTFIDLKMNLLSQIRKKFMPVKQLNGFRYADVPNDFYVFSTASKLDDRNNIQPLSRNEFWNTTEPVVEETCDDRKCKTCGQSSSEVCFEATNYTATTEDVIVPNTVTTKCDYSAHIPPLDFPYTVFGIATSSGFTEINTVVNNQGELDSVMEGIGLTKVGNSKYGVTNTAIIYDFLYFFDGDGDIHVANFVAENCIQDSSDTTTYQKVTTLKVCSNGDVVREVCEPIVMNTAGVTVCDYSIDLAFNETLCRYSINFNPNIQICNYSFSLSGLVYPLTNVTVSIGGISYNSGVLADFAALSTWLQGLGFGVSGTTFSFNGTSQVIGSMYITYGVNTTTIAPTVSSCVTDNDTFPYWIYGYTKNGSFITDATFIEDYSDLVNFFASIGFAESSTNVFIKLNSADVFTSIAYGASAPNTGATSTQVFVQDQCDDTQALLPPFTLKSYTKNLNTTTVNTAITDNSDLISVFGALGIYLVGDGEYTIYQTSDVWNHVVITYNGTDFTFNFTPENCFVTTTHVVEQTCNTNVDCNVEVKACGCIVDTSANCAKLKSCCGDILESCCTNSLKNLASATPYPTAPNPFGGYKFDESTGRIYLDDYFCGDKVLISYYTDGSINGQYYIADWAVPAAMAGIYWRSIQFNKRVGLGEKSYAERQYGKAMDKLFREQNPFNIAELSRALQTATLWNAPLLRSSRQLYYNRFLTRIDTGAN